MGETEHLLSSKANAERLAASMRQLGGGEQPRLVQQALTNVGTNIAAAREALEYTVEELAHRARITPADVLALERGAAGAPMVDLLAVMYVLWRLEALEAATDIHVNFRTGRRDP
ncbi:helix-turn-helix domain-containing protein [Arthrobacter sp. KK5.5]|uniref:helix-turn-helix domain-containing protein n=1 Tax=Arthrobacter sp. KK5.5 TaxID=3373084 RepID=UPI003EE45304